MPLKTTAGDHGGEAIKGRGATINIEGRFEVWQRDAADDGWFQDPGDDDARPKTVITIEHAKSVISMSSYRWRATTWRRLDFPLQPLTARSRGTWSRGPARPRAV